MQKSKSDHGYHSAINNIEGTILTDLGRYDEAIVCFDEILEIDAGFLVAWNNKGRTLRAMGEHGDALKCYDMALEIDPRHAPPWSNKGNCLVDLERAEDALQCFEKALEIDDKWWAAWNGMGNAFSQLKRFKDAERCYRRAIKLEPENKGLLQRYEKMKEAVMSGNDVNHKTDGTNAQDAPEKATRATMSRDALVHQCLAHWEVKQYGEALSYIRTARSRYAVDEAILNIEGVCLHELGLYDEALACFEAALDIDPLWVNSWSNKGRALRATGRQEEAIACYDKAIDCDPSQTIPWLNKASCLLYLGRREQAVECYRQALEIEPANKSIQAKLSQLLQ